MEHNFNKKKEQCSVHSCIDRLSPNWGLCNPSCPINVAFVLAADIKHYWKSSLLNTFINICNPFIPYKPSYYRQCLIIPFENVSWSHTNQVIIELLQKRSHGPFWECIVNPYKSSYYRITTKNVSLSLLRMSHEPIQIKLLWRMSHDLERLVTGFKFKI